METVTGLTTRTDATGATLPTGSTAKRRVSKLASTCCRTPYSPLPRGDTLMWGRVVGAVVGQGSVGLCYFGDYQGGDS